MPDTSSYRAHGAAVLSAMALFGLAACGEVRPTPSAPEPTTTSVVDTTVTTVPETTDTTATTATTETTVVTDTTDTTEGPDTTEAPDPTVPAEPGDGIGSTGNPDGGATVPAAGEPVDTSNPDQVVGDGTPGSCTPDAVVAAVAAGGIVTFDCGPDPVTITMTEAAAMGTDELVLDGGGMVTLSGGGSTRILEAIRCQGISEPRWCASGPQLTIQNIAMVDADSSKGLEVGGAEEGGGAVMARGTRVSVINSRFSDNACVAAGADPGGAAIRVITTPIGEPNVIANSTFENGSCSNGGGVSGLHADFAIYNSLFTGNEGTGIGQNHPDPNGGTDGVGQDGQPGGGLGGGVYMDGKWLTLTIAGSAFEGNSVTELGGALFFVDNGLTGSVSITSSTFDGNPATEQDRWGSTPGLYIQGVEGYPNAPLTGDQIGGVISDTTLQ